MAEDNNDVSKEYRESLVEMMRELDEGCVPDKVAMNHLKSARHKLHGKEDKQLGKRKRSSKSTDEGRLIRVNAAVAIWKDVLYRYTQQPSEKANGFRIAFTQDGMTGYKKFVNAITVAMRKSVDREENLTPEEKDTWKGNLEKYQGWLANITLNMGKNLWDFLVSNLKEDETAILGNPGFYDHKKELLQGWTKELAVAKTGGNAKYANKIINFGDVSIETAKGGTRPSRSIPEVRSLHFLRPEQVVKRKDIGKGVQGQVFTCHIRDCPVIQPNVLLVAKRFKEGDKHKRRADALQEVMMGGLDHRGIVGALAMTIEDPPKLVYDYYNGGDLASFIDKCYNLYNNKGKGKAVCEVDCKFVSEKKIFLQNRLGIALALLETMQFLHGMDRVHADFHFANILLHFDYDDDVATKVYVGMCDFGMSKHLSQCRLKEQQMFPIVAAKVVKYRLQFPQLAPELVGPEPAPYSKATDIYAMGNILHTLLQVHESWDGETKGTRCLAMRWNPHLDTPKLDDIINRMMAKDRTKRESCQFWSMKMVQAFPECGLQLQNSPYLRD